MNDYSVRYLGTEFSSLTYDNCDHWPHTLSEDPESVIEFVNADTDSEPGDSCMTATDREIYDVELNGQIDRIFVDAHGEMSRV